MGEDRTCELQAPLVEEPMWCVVACAFKLLSIIAEVAYDSFYIFDILLSILFDILLNRSPIIQTAFIFRISCQLVFILPSVFRSMQQ
jgi:hypothetical protein